MNTAIEASTSSESTLSVQDARAVLERVRKRLSLSLRGRDEVIELVLIALLADGHVLLEDYPGSGKTTLAKALGDAIEDDAADDQIVSFRRIQFTPDLLPSDITGTTVFDPNTNRFFFRPGPVFAHVVLADEINRTSPKVQAAMLEAMGEKQATVDNETHTLDELFFVIATQNPLDLAGTFPLPSPQLDRFLFKIEMKHIDRASELDVLASIAERRSGPGRDLPRAPRRELLAARRTVEEQVFVAPEIREALVDVAAATREHPPRAARGVHALLGHGLACTSSPRDFAGTELRQRRGSRSPRAAHLWPPSRADARGRECGRGRSRVPGRRTREARSRQLAGLIP